jgi:hypothetical protein
MDEAGARRVHAESNPLLAICSIVKELFARDDQAFGEISRSHAQERRESNPVVGGFGQPLG